MTEAAGSITNQHLFHGPAWYQEPYFSMAVQGAIERARSDSEALGIIVLRIAGCSRKIAHALVLYAETSGGDTFFGLLAGGDYAICLPGKGPVATALERVSLERALAAFDLCSGVAVLQDEETAAVLLHAAMEDCSFGDLSRPPSP